MYQHPYNFFCLSETEIYALTLAMQSDANRMVEEFQVITKRLGPAAP